MLKRTQDAHKWKAPSMATTSHGAENEVAPAAAYPYLSLSAAHISWYKLIRKMPSIGPLEAPQHAPCLIFIDDRNGKPGAFVGTVASARFPQLEPVALREVLNVA